MLEMMHYTPLEKSIVKTVVFFDLLDFPLTATEVWKYLHRPELPESDRSLLRVSQTLSQSRALKDVLGSREAFYCLRGREDLIPLRKRRNLRVDGQLKKTVRIVKLLRLFPSIRMIAIYNSLALGNVKEESDIDLFIVARKGDIWRSRFCSAGILKLLRLRPRIGKTRDTFCLSFFITEDALNIERASLGGDDIAFQYFVQNFLPLYDPDGLYKRFRDENAWLRKYLPNADYLDRLICEVPRTWWLDWWHSFFSVVTWPVFNGPWSAWICRLQLRILPASLKSIANIDTRVIVSDTMLKFHDKDTRHQLRKRWQESLQHYGIH